jgi:polyhydroxyalkanoate synthesis regulator phasin
MPVEVKGNGFPITLRVPNQRFSKRFNSDVEVHSWVQQEIDWWRERNPQKFSEYFPDAAHHLQFLALLTGNLLQEALRQSQSAEILSAIEKCGVLVTGGKQGQLLAKIYDETPLLFPGAVIALSASTIDLKVSRLAGHLNNQSLAWPLLLSGLGAVVAAAGAERTSDREKQKFEELVARTEAATEESETRLLEICDLRDSARQRFDAEHAEQALQSETAVERFRASLESELSESKERIRALEQQVRERLVLEAPTIYWSKKADSHRATAAIFGMAFLIALAGGVYWLTHYGVDLVGEAYQTIVGDRENPGLLALVPLAFITLPTLAFAWLLRHVSRIIVQNLSLQADAQLRGTIATTYSALVTEPNGTTPELAIALNALFRPVDGSGHTEIVPPNVKDIIEMGRS